VEKSRQGEWERGDGREPCPVAEWRGGGWMDIVGKFNCIESELQLKKDKKKSVYSVPNTLVPALPLA
jgi:hypothetical protein